jgi:uncharacterized protein (DUF2249 family)
MKENIVTLDVREDLRNGREPFSKIMNAVGQLRPDEKLLLVAPFEPAPLFDVLAKRGFSHSAREIENGDWEIIFTRNGIVFDSSGDRREMPLSEKSTIGNQQSALLEVDARGLEPPQPLVRILEALAALPDGAELRAHTDRRPMHLYAQLEERGFTGETEEQNDGSFITRIRRH